MRQQRPLQVVLVVVGLLFVATIYPLIMLLREGKEAYAPMMLSLYITLGIFLLVASRNPLAHRSLIGFTAWSSFAHAAVMTVQALQGASGRADLLRGSAVFVVIGAALLWLIAGKQASEVGSAARA
jgi:tryptophan-rich sensory protein